MSGETEKSEQHEDDGKLTLDDVKAMSQDEINERWDEVQAVLRGTANA